MANPAANVGDRDNDRNEPVVIDLVSSSDDGDDDDGDDRKDEVRMSSTSAAATTTTGRSSTSFVIQKLVLESENSESSSDDESDTNAFLYKPSTFRSRSGETTKNKSYGKPANSTDQKKPSLVHGNAPSISDRLSPSLKGEKSGRMCDHTNSTTTDRKVQHAYQQRHQRSTNYPFVTPSSREQKRKLKKTKDQEIRGNSSAEESKPSAKRRLIYKEKTRKTRRKNAEQSPDNSKETERSNTPSIADDVKLKKKKREMYIRGPLTRGFEAFKDRQSNKGSTRPTKNELNWCILKVLKELPEPKDKIGIVRTELSDLVHGYCGVHIVQQHPMGGQPKFEYCNMEELEERRGHGFVTRDRKRLNTDKKHNRFLITQLGREAFDIVSGHNNESEQAKKGKITNYFQQHPKNKTQTASK